MAIPSASRSRRTAEQRSADDTDQELDVYVVGIEVEVRIPAAGSLKDKRRVITSVLDTARRRLHVSAAEVGAQDSWQRAVLGFAVVASSVRLAEETLGEIERLLWARPELEIVTIEQQWAE